MSRIKSIFLSAALIPLFGCAGVGTYFADRGRDFLDPWRIEAGMQGGIGGGGKAAGLAHLGIGVWLAEPHLMAGVRYGRLEPGPQGGMTMEGHFPFAAFSDPLGNWFFLHPEGRGLYGGAPDRGGHGCWWILPILLSVESEPPRWVDRFDVEATATAIMIGAGFGIRLGELADFFGGWFGWDPALDDTGAPKPKKKKPLKAPSPPDDLTPEARRFMLGWRVFGGN